MPNSYVLNKFVVIPYNVDIIIIFYTSWNIFVFKTHSVWLLFLYFRKTTCVAINTNKKPDKGVKLHNCNLFKFKIQQAKVSQKHENPVSAQFCVLHSNPGGMSSSGIQSYIGVVPSEAIWSLTYGRIIQVAGLLF